VLIAIFLGGLIWQAQFSRYAKAEGAEGVLANPKNSDEIVMCSDGTMSTVALNSLIDAGEKCKIESKYSNLIPALQERYGKRTNLHVLEIEPRRSTSVARALSRSTQLYIGVDGEVVSRAQQLFLDAEGVQKAKAISGSQRKLPIVDSSQDLVVARRSQILNPERASVYKDVARVLKRDGEFVLYEDSDSNAQATSKPIEGLEELRRIALASPRKNKDAAQLIVYGKKDHDTVRTLHGTCEFIDLK